MNTPFGNVENARDMRDLGFVLNNLRPNTGWFGECSEFSWVAEASLQPGEPISQAVSRLWHAICKGGEMPARNARGVLYIPNGEYELEQELNLRNTPFIDIFGESREGTILRYSGKDNRSVLWTDGAECMIAHMTLERAGQFEEPTGKGVRYAVHDHGVRSNRCVVLADLDCKTTEAVGSPGVGSGVCSGGLLFYVNVKCDYGFFLHNADNRREAWENGRPIPRHGAPATIMLIDCLSGNGPRIAPPNSGLVYWNMGSGQKDRVVICGGSHYGRQFGLNIVNFGPPFPGESETEFWIGGGAEIFGGVADIRKPLDERTATAIAEIAP